ncbi:MAG: PilZ domain-containing protein [Candidatus Aminicenantes bacterium]|nr:PilZ domain-containing protein [Candidatus Aminicenantes bacterium]
MTKKPSSKKNLSSRKLATSSRFPTQNRRKELRFDLPLSATIEGKLPTGEDFKEETVIQNISSGGAYFALDANIIIGSKLNVFVEIPDQSGKNKKTKLSLAGSAVRLESTHLEEKRIFVAMHFNKKYRFINERST